MQYNIQSPNEAPRGLKTAPPTGSNIRLVAIVTLAALLLIILLSGCASIHIANYDDPYSYNSNTDCPVIGDPPDDKPVLPSSPASRPASESPFPRIEPHAYDLGQQQNVFPRTDPHQY